MERPTPQTTQPTQPTQTLIHHIKAVLGMLYHNVYVGRWVSFTGEKCITVHVTTAEGIQYTFEQEWMDYVWDTLPPEVIFEKIIHEVTTLVMRGTIQRFATNHTAPTFYSWKQRDF